MISKIEPLTTGVKMQRIIFTIFLILILAMPTWARQVNIGVVTDGPMNFFEELFQIYEAEIKGLLEPEYQVKFSKNKSFQGNWDKSSINSSLNAALSDRSIDMVLAFGTIASHMMIGKKNLTKPVVAPFILDPDLQIGDTKLHHNLNIIAFPNKIQAELSLFQSLTQADSLTVLINELTMKMIPQLEEADFIKQAKNCDINFIRAGNNIKKILAQIPENTNGVYFTPLLHLSSQEFQTLTDGLIQKKIPSFSMIGLNDLDRGILATAAGDFLERAARLTALNIQLILHGNRPNVLTTAYKQEFQLVINRKVANAIGFETPFSLITEVAYVGDDASGKTPALTLDEAVRMALLNNADIATAYYEIDEKRQDVKLAQSDLRPSITTSIMGYQIDEDRAESSMGSQAEQTLEANLKLTQIVYSEKAWANLDIQKRLFEARQNETQTIVHNIKESTATAYVDVLHAQALLEIQRENLNRSRKYLDLAKLRESVGQAGSSEVYRWMNMIATNKQDLIQAMNQVDISYTELNRLIGLSQSGKSPLEDLTGRSHIVLGEDLSKIQDRFSNPSDFRVFQDFMVKESFKNSPEIKQLDATLKAYDRQLLSDKRTFYMPTIGLEAEVTRCLAESGSGQSGLSIPGMKMSKADDTDWSIGLSLNYPIFEGGRKRAALKQSRIGIKRLRSERLAVRQQIEQRMRTRMMQNHTSYSDIGLSKEAASAADKSLALAQDTYQRGVGSILDLIDAQNASLVSSRLEATSIYQFYKDYIRTRRAAGSMDFDPMAEENRCFRKRMDYYMKTKQYNPDCSGE